MDAVNGIAVREAGYSIVDDLTAVISVHKSPLSGAGKHPDFQVTLCLHFDSTDVNFAYIESE